MDGSREVLATPAKGFLVDMGRWRKVASIDKVLHNEVGLYWGKNSRLRQKKRKKQSL